MTHPSSASSASSRGTPLAFVAMVVALFVGVAIGSGAVLDLSTREIVSLGVQHLFVVSMFVALDGAFARPAIRTLLGTLLFGYLVVALLDTLSLATFSARAGTVVRLVLLGGDVASVLRQAYVSAATLIAVAATIAGALGAFLVLYRRMPRRAPRTHAPLVSLATTLLLAAAFVGEQAAARDRDTYMRRSTILPSYYRVFSLPGASAVVWLRQPVADELVDAAVKDVQGARNRKNVLFILLESIRHDVLTPEISPSLTELGKRSLVFTRAYTESPNTARVWNVLLLNRPMYSVFQEGGPMQIGRPRAEPGAFSLRVLEKAGYQIFISMPTQFDWFGFQNRFMGPAGLVDRFFSSYNGTENDRHLSDDRATDEVVKWIEEPGLPEPFFAIIQLDSSHYTYFFHEDRAVVEPYADAISPYLVNTQDGLDLLFNRYQNSIHHVDSNVGRMLDALTRSGRLDDTAIVVVSDHGQGFELGSVAHVALAETTKRIPMLMSLPGVRPGSVDDFACPGDVFPTLFDYLDVEGLDLELFLGRSLLDRSAPRASALTLQGAMKEAHLSFPLFTVTFDVARDGNRSLTFEPTAVLDAKSKPIPRWRELLEQIPWRDELRRHLSPTIG